MMLTRSATTILVLVVCCGSSLSAQTAASPTQVATPETPAAPESGAAREWTFSAVVSGCQVPDDRIYPQPTLTADRGWLHLEARYNYEDIDTGRRGSATTSAVARRWRGSDADVRRRVRQRLRRRTGYRAR